MVFVSIDESADMVLLSLRPGTPVDFTEPVGRSLLANYDEHDALVSVEILSRRALGRPEVISELQGLVGDLVWALSTPQVFLTATPGVSVRLSQVGAIEQPPRIRLMATTRPVPSGEVQPDLELVPA
jgi:hypothetical protein